MSLQEAKRIGELNGPWAIGLKIMLATYPIMFASLLGWGTWVTKELIVLGEFRNRGDRFTKTDAVEMRREIDAQFSQLPPKDWKDRYIAMERQLLDNRDMLVRLQSSVDGLKSDFGELRMARYPKP